MGGGMEFFERVANRAGLKAFLDSLKWDEHGRVVVVSQDVRNSEVLGVAFANRIAVEKSLKTGFMHYYSRSRGQLWKKGESSGHFQKLAELRVDCDGDALVAKVRQVKANCHLGFRSCFSYTVSRNKKRGWIVKQVGKHVFDPEKVYTKRTKPAD